MRLNKTLISTGVIAIMALLGTHAHSQLIQDAASMAVPSFSGNTGSFTPSNLVAPDAGFVPNAGFAPNAGVVVNNLAPNSGIVANSSFGTPTVSAAPVASQMQYAPQSVGTPYYSAQPNSTSYSPLMIGSAPNGCANCDLTPVPTEVPYRIPVTSCCGGANFGRLGVPKLTTPIRYDMPPVGRAYGRPLFGKWTGF